MKRLITLLVAISLCACLKAQLTGEFKKFDDGHIYFVLKNPTSTAYYVSWTTSNNFTNEHLNGSFSLPSWNSSLFGPSTIGWTWIKGERITISVYPYNPSYGNPVYWECPITDPSIKSKQPSFKGSEASTYNGRKCGVRKSNGFYCDCSGCSSGNWDPYTCTKCGHKCNQHTR